MTERNTAGEQLSERDVDRLLQQFFLDEVPVEFRQTKSSVAHAQPQLATLVQNATSDSSRSLAGMLGILVSATCCLVVTLFIPSPSTDDAESTPSTTLIKNERPQPALGDALPIEERSHLPFTSTGENDDSPRSETESTEPLVPELEIEIFPLRPDQSGE